MSRVLIKSIYSPLNINLAAPAVEFLRYWSLGIWFYIKCKKVVKGTILEYKKLFPGLSLGRGNFVKW